MDAKTRLIELIREKSFKKTDEPSFTLVSGKKSCFYFNMKKVTYHPEGIALIGSLVYEKVKELNLNPNGIGGLTMGADPIAVATSYTSFLKDDPIEAFAVRKERKGHGAALQIEGNIEPNDKVIIIDDVITTGKSTIQAINIVKEAGIEIISVIALVDRCEENGKSNIEALGPKCYSIFDINDFV